VYLLSVAGLIACKDANLFEAFSCSWPPPSTFYKRLEIERPSTLPPLGSNSGASSPDRQHCEGSRLRYYRQQHTGGTKTSTRRGSLTASRWTRGSHQQRRQGQGSLSLQTSTRLGPSAPRSCADGHFLTADTARLAWEGLQGCPQASMTSHAGHDRTHA